MASTKWAGVLAVAVVLAMPAARASAQPPLFVVDEGPYEVSDGEVTIGVINLSEDDLIVELESATCSSDDPAKVAGGTSESATFELSDSCTLDEPEAVSLVGRAGEVTHTIEVTLIPPKDDEQADYAPLVGFLIGMVGALVLTVGALVVACGRPSRAKFREKMPWLDADWSFNESWAANTGLAAALFTGLFGATDVLKELVGDGADVAVVVVAAAAAAGLVGAGPMLLTMFKSGGEHTRRGVVLASWSVLSAHIGLIATLIVMLDGNDVTGRASKLIGAVAIGLLILYTMLTLPSLLKPPATDDEEVEKSDEVKALEQIAVAVNRVALALGAPMPEGAVPAIDDLSGVVSPSRKRRAALI